MGKILTFIVISGFFILFFQPAFAATSGESDQGKVTLSGYVRDQSNGEVLTGVTVYCTDTKTGAVTNLYGFYSLGFKPGKYTIRYTYVGFVTQEKAIEMDKNTTLDINLEMLQMQLGAFGRNEHGEDGQ